MRVIEHVPPGRGASDALIVMHGAHDGFKLSIHAISIDGFPLEIERLARHSTRFLALRPPIQGILFSFGLTVRIASTTKIEREEPGAKGADDCTS